MRLERATIEFVAAAIEAAVGNCIAIAGDTPNGMWTNAADMKDAIVKRLEDFRTSLPVEGGAS